MSKGDNWTGALRVALEKRELLGWHFTVNRILGWDYNLVLTAHLVLPILGLQVDLEVVNEKECVTRRDSQPGYWLAVDAGCGSCYLFTIFHRSIPDIHFALRSARVLI